MSDFLPISVVIPVHNNELTLNRALKSVKGCAEIIIICDACSDNSLQIAKKFDCKVSKKIQSVDFRDPGSSRFHGVQLASFQYICFLDADDEFLEGKLEHQYKYMVSSQLKWTCTHYNVMKESGDFYVVSPPDIILKSDLLRVNDIGMSTVMVHKEILEDEDNFPNRPLEDWKLWLTLAQVDNCYTLNFVGTNYYRSNSHNWLYFYKNIKNRFLYLRKWKKFFHAVYFMIIYLAIQIKRRI